MSASLNTSLSAITATSLNPSDGAVLRSLTRQSTASSGKLTPAQEREVAQLQRVDQSVRAHEQAHISVGRELITGGPDYTYTYGPDGKRYVTGGEVGIDTSPAKTPEANIDKGQHIQATALAPKDPSPQDYRVASLGAQMEASGRAAKADETASSTTAADTGQSQNQAKSETDTTSAKADEAPKAREAKDKTPQLVARQEAVVRAYESTASEKGSRFSLFA